MASRSLRHRTHTTGRSSWRQLANNAGRPETPEIVAPSCSARAAVLSTWPPQNCQATSHKHRVQKLARSSRLPRCISFVFVRLGPSTGTFFIWSEEINCRTWNGLSGSYDERRLCPRSAAEQKCGGLGGIWADRAARR